MRSSLHASHDREKTRGRIIDRLDRLGEAARTMGMHDLAQKLETIAADVDEEFKALRQAIHDDLNSQFRETQQNTANILTSLLAGVELARSADAEAGS